MKAVFMWNWKKNVSLLLLITFGVITYLPSINLKFSLLDDGLTILNSRLISTSITNLDVQSLLAVLLEPLNGRVRPVYWLAQSLMTIISLQNSNIFHLWRLSLLVATMLVAYKIMSKLRIHYSVIFLSILIYIFNIQNLENYYRLGPVEPFIVLILVLIFNLLFFSKNNNKYLYINMVTLNFLGTFIKENFFVVGMSLLPILVLPQVRKNNIFLKKLLFLSISSVVFGVCVFAIKNSYPPLLTDYSSNYVINIPNIINNGWKYVKMISHYQSPFFELSLIYLIFIVVQIFKNGLKKLSIEYLFTLCLWLVVLSQLFVLSPWKFMLNRYISFVNINLILIYSITLSAIFNKLFFLLRKINNKYMIVIVTSFFAIMYSQTFIRNYFDIANYQLYAKTDSDVSFNSIMSIANFIPNNSTLFVNYKKGDSNIELFEEMGWHLEEFYGRYDIKIEYLDEFNSCSSQDRYVFDRRSDRFYDQNVFENEKVFTKLVGESSIYRPINYGVVLKSFKSRYKYSGWNDEHVFDWAVYLQKGGTCVENK